MEVVVGYNTEQLLILNVQLRTHFEHVLIGSLVWPRCRHGPILLCLKICILHANQAKQGEC